MPGGRNLWTVSVKAVYKWDEQKLYITAFNTPQPMYVSQYHQTEVAST